MNKLSVPLIGAALWALTACSPAESRNAENNQTGDSSAAMQLPVPYATKSVAAVSKVIGWPADQTPVAPAGFSVSKYAIDFDNPRWIYVAPNGDVFIAEVGSTPKTNRITLFRDRDGDGVPELRETVIDGLKMPMGMLVLKDSFYIACTDELIQFPYKEGQTKLNRKDGKTLMSLPAGGYNNHWTRNIVANAAGTKLYVSVGSGSNVGENGMEHEERRANILELRLSDGSQRIYASGLRNPVGMDWEPVTGQLWTAVNERDGLGDDLVPDYITSVQESGFYGWPYSYFGQNEDPNWKGKEANLVKSAIVPDVPLGSHTASLGLSFCKTKLFPEKYQGGAFVGQHGSWNRSVLAGYRVAFVPFKNGKPSGEPEDFLGGFIADLDKREVFGRPVAVAFQADGSMLVSDDASNVIWKVKWMHGE